MSLKYIKAHEPELDKLFCLNAKKYGLKKLLLKAVGICESSLDMRAFRHEPGFWNRYLKDDPEWNTRNKAEVSSSYGIMQLMYPTAWMLGFRGPGEELYDPVYNIELGAKYIRQLLDAVIAKKICETHFWLSPLSVTLARYNGGKYRNPDSTGNLRNQKYVDKIFRTWNELKISDNECED